MAKKVQDEAARRDSADQGDADPMTTAVPVDGDLMIAGVRVDGGLKTAADRGGMDRPRSVLGIEGGRDSTSRESLRQRIRSNKFSRS